MNDEEIIVVSRDDDDENEGCPGAHICIKGTSSFGWCIEMRGHAGQHLCGRCGSYFDDDDD